MKVETTAVLRVLQIDPDYFQLHPEQKQQIVESCFIWQTKADVLFLMKNKKQKCQKERKGMCQIGLRGPHAQGPQEHVKVPLEHHL